MSAPENRRAFADARAADRNVAVIDVGSNSVRLVLYRVDGRAIWTVYNEKVLAGLGRDLGSTGKLSREGVKTAMTALRRFRAVLDGVRPAEILTAATAAVRDAKDGPAFVRKVAAETGLSLRVLSGEEEAYFAALGVKAGAPGVSGVVGDLGGASLELVGLDANGVEDAVTLALGPFALGAGRDVDTQSLRGEVERRVAAVEGRFAGGTLHAVGGAWRNLALLHMRRQGYPLRIVHQYEIGRAEALEAARLIARQSVASLEPIGGVSKKRLETLPYAALVMEVLIERLGIERVMTSAYGLREGLLFEAMDEAVRELDPLVEGCNALACNAGSDEALGPALEDWLRPMHAALPPLFDGRDAVLASAACRLAGLGSRLHPDHRAQLIFEQVLRSPIAGQTHPERAFLAVAAFARHTGSAGIPEERTIARVLPDEHHHRARVLGTAIRLGCDLSGRSAALLTHSRLDLTDRKLVLSAAPAWADMLLGEQTARRAGTLAGLLGVKLEMRAK